MSFTCFTEYVLQEGLSDAHASACDGVDLCPPLQAAGVPALLEVREDAPDEEPDEVEGEPGAEGEDGAAVPPALRPLRRRDDETPDVGTAMARCHDGPFY